MLSLVTPRSSVTFTPAVFKTFPAIWLVVFLFAVVGVEAGCSSLNAGSTNSAGSSSGSQPMTVAARLPMGAVGSAYNGIIFVSGGTPPYSVAIRTGALPPGLSLNSTSGKITGLPKTSGSYGFTTSIADSSHTARLERFAISVGQGAPIAAAVAVSISPASLSLGSGSSYQFAAQVVNASNTQVTWSASGGTISATGLFTAPSLTNTGTVQLIATSKADPSKRAIASITVNPAAASATPLSITNTSLPEATESAPYSATLHASGGTAPYHWKIASGTLPLGLAFETTDASIGGITTQTGAFPFVAELSDASGQTTSRKLSLNVAISSTGATDGPAELPRVYMKTSLADTPAPGAVQTVKSGGNLQAALASAKCGDTIQLQAGATFTGAFTLPAKPCDDNHWIVIRTSAPDSALPAEGTRVTPCYAGVAALPGRPSFGCSTAKNVLAKLVFGTTGSGPIQFADGANHYRFMGLEITRTGNSPVYNLIINAHGGTSDHIVIDRSWVHGTAQEETTRGLMLTGNSYVAVVDSFFSDFHCVAVSGACVDSQAIGGGIGSEAMGPYKVVNNFLEAAGENIIFGGGPADHTAEDIEIRRNHFYKPLIWMKGQKGFVGGRDGHPFIVKNHFELKNGIRVLFEGNILENSWGGFSQTGFSILLTPKNQNGGCPICVVHDVTIRFNTINHAGNGFQIGNGPSDSGALSQGMWNVSIHDVVVDDVDGATYNGGGYLWQESNGNPLSVLHDIAINHVTALGKNPKAALLIVGNNKSYPEMYGFVWSNNIFTSSGGVLTTGGGAVNCAYQQGGPAGVIKNCFKDSTFAHNVLIGAVGTWPPANFLPASTSDVRFTSTTVADPLASYRLQPGSPFAHAATDGKDLGADIVALTAAITGVR